MQSSYRWLYLGEMLEEVLQDIGSLGSTSPLHLITIITELSTEELVAKFSTQNIQCCTSANAL